MKPSSPPQFADRGRVQIDGLSQDYGQGEQRLTVLDDVSFVVEPGEFVAITGPSGSGKSTLLALIAGLDRPSRGSVVIDDTDISRLSEDELAAFRGRAIGFVFQSFQLIATLTALENVRVVGDLVGMQDAGERARDLLDQVGLGHRLTHYPAQLSGGEMQRVAIARASMAPPVLLLADEPTGNLDSVAGEQALRLLFEVNRRATLVLVTHDPGLAARADREIRLRDGRLVDVVPGRGERGRLG
jgi:putative ABC transport system ATP-binding protein